MKIVLFFLLVVSLPNSSRANGGSTVGDGGWGVQCPSEYLQVLDLYEYRKIFHQPPDMRDPIFLPSDPEFSGGVGRAMLTVSMRAGELLGDHHPLVQLIRDLSYSLGFEPFAAWKRMNDPISAAGRIEPNGLDPRCDLVEIARSIQVNGHRRVEIDSLVAAGLPDEDLAAILIHEAIHPWFAPEADSRPVRQAVRFFLSPKNYRLKYQAIFRTLVTTKQPQEFPAPSE